MLSKPSLDAVGRQQRRDVDVEGQQVANGVGVFRPVQAMQRRRVEVGAGRRRAVEARFEIAGEGVEHGALGPPRAARRHHARADLADDLFPRRRVLPDVFEIHPVEQQAAGLQPLVVTGDAVLIEQRRLLRGRGRWAPQVLARRRAQRPGRPAPA